MSKNVRTLTVYQQPSAKCYDKFPRIMLQGKWLQDLGFEAGQKINITVSKNIIVIERGACCGEIVSSISKRFNKRI